MTVAERVASLPVQGDRGIYALCRELGIGGPECSRILDRQVPDYTKASKAELVRCITTLARESTEAEIRLRRFLATADDAAAQEARPRAVAPKPAVPVSNGEDPATVLQHAIALLTRQAAGSVDEDRVRAIVAEALHDLRPAPLTVQVIRQDAEPIDVGVQHKRFPDLLRALNATVNGKRLNVWLAGPPGTGKTTAARKCAEAMSLTFYFTGAIESKYDLIGFVRPDGVAVRTPFRDAWEHGGVFLFDEVDGSSPQALVAFNAALANGVAAFPDAIVPRHADCCIIAAANTHGHGGDSQTAGRVRQDGPFLDRFVFMEWPIDEALEESMGAADTRWLRIVQKLRARAAERKLRATITPRAVEKGLALLAAGWTVEQTAEATCRNGMPDATWRELCSGIV